jgi:ketosteroid isomerase-like protein
VIALVADRIFAAIEAGDAATVATIYADDIVVCNTTSRESVVSDTPAKGAERGCLESRDEALDRRCARRTHGRVVR